MIVEANTVRFDVISLDGGATLAPVDVAYETYGELNAAKTNAILVLHAFSGDAHAAASQSPLGNQACTAITSTIGGEPETP